MKKARISISALSLLLLASAVGAQGVGDFLNQEAPQVEPITVARVGGHDYVLACNTADNSLEVYDTANNSFVFRIPVGYGPVSVLFDEESGRFWTANMTGDSVTLGTLKPGSPRITYTVQGTNWVGDEPMHLALDSSGLNLFVAKRSSSSFAWLNATTGLVFGADFYNLRMIDTGLSTTSNPVSGAMAVKEPHTVRIDPTHGTRLVVLGHQGGGAPVQAIAGTFDLDVWVHDFAGATTSTIGGLGTTNFNMAFAANGELYVVSTEAQNNVVGVASLAVLPTGFVTTLLHKVTNLGGTPAVATRNLNTDTAGAPVAAGQSLAHATDVKVYEPPGGIRRVCVTAYNSDGFAMIDVASPNPQSWTVQRINVNPITHPVAGPRALAIKYASSDQENDPGDRIYTLNRLDNSITVIDPTGAAPTVVATFALQNDPVPARIRGGQQFLFSTNFSGNGFVACASCHVDARSDQERWDLSASITSPRPPIPAPLELAGVDQAIYDELTQNGMPPVKGPMVTQSLQGLVNWETGGVFQILATNAPYHWRGDKPDFVNFNEAFVNLQGMPNGFGTPTDPKGVSDAQMRQYRDYIETISYPSNPEQDFQRIYRGVLGDPDNEATGSGELLGLKLFHTRPFQSLGVPTDGIAGRSCVQCHFLPEGSNNRITDFLVFQPLESAAMRGMLQKEARLETSPAVPSIQLNTVDRTGDWGFAHLGVGPLTTNDFVGLFRGGLPLQTELDAVSAYVRSFDSGVAPSSGLSLTVDVNTKGSVGVANGLNLLEGQVIQANIGLAVYARIAGVERGFWFRITQPAGVGYREVPPGSGQLSRTALLNLLQAAGDVMIFTGTPLGSDRRVASLTGVGQVLAGPAPSNVQLVGTTPNTANLNVPLINKNWRKTLTFNGFDFFWNGMLTTSGNPVPAPEPLSLKIVRIFQQALGTFPQYGTVRYAHDAPRRIQVSGNGILEGATLTLFVDVNPNVAPQSAGPGDFLPFSVPIYPRRTSDAAVIWETAVELEPLILYMMILGGPWAPGVGPTLLGNVAEPPPANTFNPVNWNQYPVVVTNENGSAVFAGFLPLVY